MDIEELRSSYSAMPNEMLAMKRWVGYKTEQRDGRLTKVPYNAITGQYAKSNDPYTWTKFEVAIKGVLKYGLEGLGFMLGDGIFGIDLDNHPDEKTGEFPMSEKEFNEFAEEFVKQLDSYAERSVSGKGIHIICKGQLPQGRRRKGCVEMYDKGRFFACTGNVILNSTINDRTEEVIPLWKKYVDDSEELRKYAESRPVSPLGDKLGTGSNLSDTEVVRMAIQSKGGTAFSSLYSGNMSAYDNDHSAADIAFCSSLAFWCNGDREQMDRIFRSSGLMRDKWDSQRGSSTYGQMTIDRAVATMTDGYVKKEEIDYKSALFKSPEKTEKKATTMNIDENGEPIFRIRKIFKKYPFDDTGNAERFYDYFGDIFKYNVDTKTFMFWTGKTWVFDEKGIIRKYANKIIDVMKEEIEVEKGKISTLQMEGMEEEAKKQEKLVDAAEKNVKRIANKAGKDAMLSELQNIHDMPVKNSEFDQDPYLLNTQTGIVDLRSGKVSAFDKTAMLSKNTQCEISYSEPNIWLSFLRSVFWRGDDEQSKKETEEIIDFMQQAMWYSLTGLTREQVMFMMYGSGSNGKTTCVEEMRCVMGDYGNSKESSILMASQNKGTSVQYSLAELVGCRFLITEETNEGEKLDEGGVKSMTGSGKISAQKKYGNPFEFLPQFKIWMLTNNLPIIRGADFGIWRRICLIPFLRRFTDSEKDMDMPEKLKKETPQILGWCVKGHEKYQANGNRLIMPDCLKTALKGYQDDMDVVAKFIHRCCRKNSAGVEPCKDMFDTFKAWAIDNKEYILRESKFRESVIAKGFVTASMANGDICYKGIEVLPSWKGKTGYSPSSGAFDDD